MCVHILGVLEGKPREAPKQAQWVNASGTGRGCGPPSVLPRYCCLASRCNLRRAYRCQNNRDFRRCSGQLIPEGAACDNFGDGAS